MKKVLDVFSHAFVINPPGNKERLALITQRLRDLGIEFERFPALQFDGSSYSEALRGVNLSHLEVVKEARRRNLENILIMEDDAIFRPDFLRLWSILLPQLQTLDYDILYGYDWHNTSSSISDVRITPIAGTYCNHFWAIHSDYYDTFIESVELNEKKETPLPIDLIFTCKNARMYAPTYNLVGQDAGVSGLDKVMKPLRWSAAD
jgi:GR25 family glycosyltransferase involved in LPS biosynthesis